MLVDLAGNAVRFRFHLDYSSLADIRSCSSLPDPSLPSPLSAPALQTPLAFQNSATTSPSDRKSVV